MVYLRVSFVAIIVKISSMPRMSMPRPVPVLIGKLATLRPIDPVLDANDYYEWNLEPQMHIWTGNQPFASPRAARDELQRLAGMDDFSMWSIIDNASHKMIGRFFICLERRGDKLVAGEGNRAAKPFWRKGHNRETRRLIFEYIFNTLHADCIETECWTDNINSRLSILAHGFSLVCETIDHNRKYGQPMNQSHFLMTREDWIKHYEADGPS